MMTVMDRPVATVSGAECSSVARWSVEPGLVTSLRERGLSSPLRSLADPRTGFPELLLMGGWDREPVDEGFAYRFVAQEDGTGTWEQYFEQHDDGSCLLRTRAGIREQELARDAAGFMTARTRNPQA